MNSLKIVALVLIVAGALGLAYGGFSYVTATHKAEIGPLKLQVNEEKSVNVPLWLSLAAVAGGLALLVMPGKR